MVNNRKGEIDMAKNPLRRRRDIDNPYATFMSGDIEIRVLKTNKIAKTENSDKARWFTATKSPMTSGSWEYGHTDRKEVQENGRIDNFKLTYASPEFIEAYLDDFLTNRHFDMSYVAVGKGYYISEGSYQNTNDDRLGRWYIGLYGQPFYPSGEGYATPGHAYQGLKEILSENYDY